MPARRRAPAPRHTSATSPCRSPKATSRYFCLPNAPLRRPSLDKPSVCFQNIACTRLAQTPAPPGALPRIPNAWPDPSAPPLRQLSKRNSTRALLALSSTHRLTRYSSATLNQGAFSSTSPKKLESSVRKTLKKRDAACAVGLGRREKHLRRGFTAGKMAHGSAHRRSIAHRLRAAQSAPGTPGKAGGKSTERLAMAEPPAARRSLHAPSLPALFTSAGISPSPSRRARARVGRRQGNRSPGEDSLR